MKILIAGDGKVGLALTKQLLREGHDVVVIDSNPQALRNSLDQFDVMTIEGNAAAMDVLTRAGAETAELLIAATSTDESNILCCLVGRKLNPKLHTIARVRNPEYTKQLLLLQEELGLSMMINPEKAAALEIFRLLQFPSFIHRDTFARGRVEIVELEIAHGSMLADISLNELRHILRLKILVCAIERDDRVIIPDGGHILREGDHIYVTAPVDSLAALVDNIGITPKKMRQILLIGGGRVSFYLAQRLLNTGAHVKIIEKDRERAQILAEELVKAEVVWGDGSEQYLLDGEGISKADAIVTLTDMDEENIVISMYAHACGIAKVITKVNRIEYSNTFMNLGIGSVVSPKGLCCTDIVRYVRAMQHQKGSLLTLHRVANEQVEALEFRVDSSVKWRNTPLKDIPLKRGVLISCISHQGENIIPDGYSRFLDGDSVIIVTNSQSPIQKMNDIFEG